MEPKEEVIIMKSDLAIAVKKDGTFLINNPSLESWVKLWDGIADFLKENGKNEVAAYCVGELISRQNVKEAIDWHVEKLQNE